MKKSLMIAVLACVGWHGVAAAQASEPMVLDRADLSTPYGAAAVLEQIEETAHRVCHEEHGPGFRYGRAMRRCVADTVRRCVMELDSPNLTRVYAEGLSPRRRRALPHNVAMIAWPSEPL